MQASDVKKLKEFQGENEPLKKMYAEISLENRVFKELMISDKREAAQDFIAMGMSISGLVSLWFWGGLVIIGVLEIGDWPMQSPLML